MWLLGMVIAGSAGDEHSSGKRCAPTPVEVRKMKTWSESVRDGWLPGTLAGALSAALLAVRGRAELRKPLAPLNAPSHWLWGDRALRQDGRSWRYTGAGLLIHQASSLMWGVLYERFVSRPRAEPSQELRDAAVATAAAATVDFVLTPRRFTPGFEKRLSARSLLLVYGGFAVGIAVGSHLVRRRRLTRISNELVDDTAHDGRAGRLR
jgi:hypothetical protein